MGEVYAGEQLALRKPVAIKVLRPDLLRPAEASTVTRRFLREARAISAIKHPNVVEILDTGETEGRVYYVMERLYGRDLAQVLQSEGKVPWPHARGLLLQAARGLRAAHMRGIVHRDVKPANIFVVDPLDDDDEPQIKVLDFGIAKVEHPTAEDDRNLTATAAILGTASYMAPEQAFTGEVTPRSDVYALGVVAYHLLTGRVPFDGTTAIAVLSRHRNEPPVPPRTLDPSIPPMVENVVLRAMAKDPEARFASMRAMSRALAAIDQDGRPAVGEASQSQDPSSGWPASRLPISPPASPPPRRSSAWWIPGIAVAVAAAAGGIGVRAWPPEDAVIADTLGFQTAASVLPQTRPVSLARPVPLAPPVPPVPPVPPQEAPQPNAQPSPPAQTHETATAAVAVAGLKSEHEDHRPPQDRRSQTSSHPPPDSVILRGLKRRAQKQCNRLAEAGARVRVAFTVFSDGRPAGPRTQGKHYGSPLGTCVENLIFTARFSPSDALHLETLDLEF